jgi:transposase
MVGMALAKSMYAIPTWTRTVALVREHAALRAAVVGSLSSDVPSVYACDRLTAKLRVYGDMLTGCIDRVTAGLSAQLPEYGRNIAIDGSDMPAYANGQRYVSKGGRKRAADEYADPDASWGHRSAVSTRKGGGFYGYKIDMAVCTVTDLQLAWNVRTARDHEQAHALALIDTVKGRGFAVETAAMDKGYDARFVYEGCEDRDVRPIIPLTKSPGVKRGDHKTRRASTARGASREPTMAARRPKWRCPTGECAPASVWIKAERMFLMIPRDTPRFAALYRRRSAVEREFGRLKHEWALAPLRVRGLDRVRLHADLTILAQARLHPRPSARRSPRGVAKSAPCGCRPLREAHLSHPQVGWRCCSALQTTAR